MIVLIITIDIKCADTQLHIDTKDIEAHLHIEEPSREALEFVFAETMNKFTFPPITTDNFTIPGMFAEIVSVTEGR